MDTLVLTPFGVPVALPSDPYPILPSLRPPTLSRVACCLWSTVLYSERPSYRHLCVSPLRLCGSAESDLINSLGLVSLALHIYYTIQRGKSQVVILHKLLPIFARLFVQVAGSAPGHSLVNFLTIHTQRKGDFCHP